MKAIHVNTGWMVQRIYFADDAKADAAYEALKGAIDTYERFGNDKQKGVTIDTGAGSATYKTENLIGVHVEDCAASEAIIIDRAVYERTMEAKVTARLAPQIAS